MAVPTRELVSPTDLFNDCSSQPRTQASSRYPSYQRRLGTESLTGDVTSEIAEDDWERGWRYPTFEEPVRSSTFFKFVLMTLNILSSCFGLFLLVYPIIKC